MSADYPVYAEAEKLMLANVPDDYQRLHSRTVAKVMRKYAEIFGGDPELWAVTGVIHDWDYGFDPAGHPDKNVDKLREHGYPEETIQAILGHKLDLNVPRTTKMAQALLAIDETTGLLFAYSKMKGGYQDMEVKGVMKKFKDKSFAAKIDRHDIQTGVDELGITLEQHIQNMIDILKTAA